MSHSNISIFVPHLGCPNQCTFCNQRHITGVQKLPRVSDIEDAVKTAVNSSKYSPDDCEIAFFGGSFTAIDREYMCELLEVAHKYVKNHTVAGIRISTRPDKIDNEVLNLLKSYSVTSIELGAQSMCNDVLLKNNRGHTADDVITASNLIRQHSIQLGLQMMTGLYGSTYEKDIHTAKEFIKLSPDTVRIYPTVTLANTDLSVLYQDGSYIPPTLDETVVLCSKLLTMFDNEKIKIIRLGLHTIDESSYIAGPWHPALRELCDSYIIRQRLESVLDDKKSYKIYINSKDTSKFIGQKRSNIDYFLKRGINLKFVNDNNVEIGNFTVEEVK